MNIGEILRKHRKKLQLTQIQLAEEAGTTQGHISDIENGNVPRMSGDIIVRLARALQTTPNVLLGVEEEKTDGKV